MKSSGFTLFCFLVVISGPLTSVMAGGPQPIETLTENQRQIRDAALLKEADERGRKKRLVSGLSWHLAIVAQGRL